MARRWWVYFRAFSHRSTPAKVVLAVARLHLRAVLGLTFRRRAVAPRLTAGGVAGRAPLGQRAGGARQPDTLSGPETKLGRRQP